MSHDAGGKRTFPLPQEWKASAHFSGEFEQYRSYLKYWWSDGPLVLGAFMNPSKATHELLDPTLRKFGKLVKRLDGGRYGGFIVINVCNFRITDSKKLHMQTRPCSLENVDAWERSAAEVELMIVGYGKMHKSLHPFAKCLEDVLLRSGNGKNLYALDTNKDGTPKHPLYIADNKDPILYREYVKL